MIRILRILGRRKPKLYSLRFNNRIVHKAPYLRYVIREGS